MTPSSAPPRPLPPVVILTGLKFSGKSLFLEEIATRAVDAGILPVGFIQRGVFDDSGTKIGYDLVRLTDGEVLPLARRGPAATGWIFSQDAFPFAEISVTADANCCFMDEIGPLELSGGGHRSTLDHALDLEITIILVVREELEAQVGELVSRRRPVQSIRYSPDDEHGAAKQILGLLGIHKSI